MVVPRDSDFAKRSRSGECGVTTVDQVKTFRREGVVELARSLQRCIPKAAEQSCAGELNESVLESPVAPELRAECFTERAKLANGEHTTVDGTEHFVVAGRQGHSTGCHGATLDRIMSSDCSHPFHGEKRVHQR